MPMFRVWVERVCLDARQVEEWAEFVTADTPHEAEARCVRSTERMSDEAELVFARAEPWNGPQL